MTSWFKPEGYFLISEGLGGCFSTSFCSFSFFVPDEDFSFTSSTLETFFFGTTSAYEGLFLSKLTFEKGKYDFFSSVGGYLLLFGRTPEDGGFFWESFKNGEGLAWTVYLVGGFLLAKENILEVEPWLTWGGIFFFSGDAIFSGTLL